MQGVAFIAKTPEQIQGVRLLTLKAGLALEMIGLRRSAGRQSCYSIIKREFGLHGSKRTVFRNYVALLRQKGILR